MKPRTINEMIGQNPEFIELFKTSPSFNTCIHHLANGLDEVKLIADLCKIIRIQSMELEKQTIEFDGSFVRFNGKHIVN